MCTVECKEQGTEELSILFNKHIVLNRCQSLFHLLCKKIGKIRPYLHICLFIDKVWGTQKKLIMVIICGKRVERALGRWREKRGGNSLHNFKYMYFLFLNHVY